MGMCFWRISVVFLLYFLGVDYLYSQYSAQTSRYKLSNCDKHNLCQVCLL